MVIVHSYVSLPEGNYGWIMLNRNLYIATFYIILYRDMTKILIYIYISFIHMHVVTVYDIYMDTHEYYNLYWQPAIDETPEMLMITIWGDPPK